MNRNQLRYFVAAAESRSFTKAAEQFYITQTAITQQIRQLEDTLGCALYDRSTRSRTAASSAAASCAGRPSSTCRPTPRTIPTATLSSCSFIRKPVISRTSSAVRATLRVSLSWSPPRRVSPSCPGTSPISSITRITSVLSRWSARASMRRSSPRGGVTALTPF